MRRRGFLGLCGVALGGCRLDPLVLADSRDPALEALIEEMLVIDRGPLLERAARHLGAGRTVEELSHAAFHAGLRASSYADHSNHPVKAILSAQRLARATPGLEGLVAVLWAIDGISASPGGIRNPRDTGVPIGELAEGDLPLDGAEERLDEAMRKYDRLSAEHAAVALLRARGPGVVVEALCRWAPRSVLPNGHMAIAVAQYLPVLDAHGWYDAEVALRHLAYSLATPDWRPGEGTYDEALRLRSELAPSWRDGVVDHGAALELLATLRDVDEVAAVTRAAELLAEGIAPQSIWDATFLRAAEAAIYGGDEHAITATMALHDLYRFTAIEPTEQLLLLVAPGWAARLSSPTGGLDAIEPTTPPSQPEVIVAGDDPETQVSQALGWLSQGHAEAELVAATNLHIVRNHSEWHGYKVPVSLDGMAAAVSPDFAPTIRAVHATTYARGGGVPWHRLDEALTALAAHVTTGP